MKTFAIKEGKYKRRPAQAYLFYDENTELFSIKIKPNAVPERLPIILELLLKKGITEIDDYWARRFVKERIVPIDRQNIGEILRVHGLKEYKEIDMLYISMGHCSQDDFYLEEVDHYPGDTTIYIGDYIASQRKKAKLTQAQLAERCGMKQSNLSAIENSLSAPTVETLSVIASALGKTLKITFK